MIIFRINIVFHALSSPKKERKSGSVVIALNDYLNSLVRCFPKEVLSVFFCVYAQLFVIVKEFILIY